MWILGPFTILESSLDSIFGDDRFLNEVIWSYKSGGVPRRHFSRKHDNLLIYAKEKDNLYNFQYEKSYNRGGLPYRFKGVVEYEDEGGWYTKINRRDVWEISMVGRTSSERTGYPTQKPEMLIEILVNAFSNEGDIVFDGFAGSGTTGVVAVKNKRDFIMSDKSPISIAVMKERLGANVNKIENYESESAKMLSIGNSVAELIYVPIDFNALHMGKMQEEKLTNWLDMRPLGAIYSLEHRMTSGSNRIFYGEGEEALAYAERIPLLRGDHEIIVTNAFGQRYKQLIRGSEKHD
ncbi:MAG: site-specific DNA-methyltransferase [Tissierellia bacterium]|nr:site-specific DNA-methyltransferase [Tissierellia bacterium]